MLINIHKEDNQSTMKICIDIHRYLEIFMSIFLDMVGFGHYLEKQCLAHHIAQRCTNESRTTAYQNSLSTAKSMYARPLCPTHAGMYTCTYIHIHRTVLGGIGVVPADGWCDDRHGVAPDLLARHQHRITWTHTHTNISAASHQQHPHLRREEDGDPFRRNRESEDLLFTQAFDRG